MAVPADECRRAKWRLPRKAHGSPAAYNSRMTASIPAVLDFLAPWEFSPTTLICSLAAIAIYLRGCALQAADPPGVGRRIAYVGAIVAMYAVMQTRIDYYAQHVFFVHRLQHLVLHHVGPFLLALAAPQAALWKGLPDSLRQRVVLPAARSRPIRAVGRLLFDPFLAPLLFVGAIVIWLLPRLHFDAMLSLPLYQLMNWSMIFDGLPFWWLALDPAPKPPARLGYGARILMLWLVMLPQIAVGAYISLSRHDLYTVYAICGRALPISAIMDQQIGGLIVWIPGAMMSALASLVILRYSLHHSARTEAVPLH
jgi:putative membrane protein